MEARFKFEKPESITATMTLTMTVKEWEELRDQLKDAWPSWELSTKVNDLLSQARKILWSENKS